MENVPIYVKVDKYKELVEVLKNINAKLSQVDKTIEKINMLKVQEDEQLRSWTENLADVRGRLEKINQSFYE
jgi:hypothetical protein